MNEWENQLFAFQNQYKVTGKGTLAVVLHITRIAITKGLPLNANELVTEKQAKVLGLGKGAVQKILADHGITRVLAEEGGQTSRGAMGIMQAYVALLNRMQQDGLTDLAAVEGWWVDRVRDYFAAQPFTLKYESGNSFGAMIRDLFSQAERRQTEMPGATVMGTVLQHLVAAMLTILMPDVALEIHGTSVADGPTARSGDFSMADVVIHCTTSASEGLMRKCQRNMDSGHRPIIITIASRVEKAENMIEDNGLKGKIDVWDIEQFLSTNIYELSKFQVATRKPTIERIIEVYNEIVSKHETDPSLKIEIG